MTSSYYYPTITLPINAEIYLPGSKSSTNRALLISALANGTSYLKNILDSDDTTAMKTVLKQLGIRVVENSDDNYNVQGCAGQFPNQSATINCHDAGTVLRFLLPICGYNPGVYNFQGSEQLKRRPISPLIDVMKEQGAEFQFLHNDNQLPFHIKGISNPKVNKLFISGDMSSQFLSGLLIGAPLTKNETFIITKDLVSKPYVEMTCHMMREFGVKVEKIEENTFHIPANQTYQSINYSIEPDLSTASYFFAAAALTNGTITLKGIEFNKCQQGDIFFVEILKQMGCSIKSSNNSITVIGTPHLKNITVNLRDYSDLFMTVACLCAFADGPSKIEGIGHIRLKESDRIYSTKTNLAKLGIEMVECSDNDTVMIMPAKPHAATLNSFDDHRIVMAFSLFGLHTPGIVMENAACVSKTCPNFNELWQQILPG